MHGEQGRDAMSKTISKVQTPAMRRVIKTLARIFMAAALTSIASWAPVHAAGDLEKPKLQEGLEVSYQISTGPASLNGLLGGSFDAAGVNWFGFVTAYNRGLPLTAASELDRGAPGYTSFVVRSDSPIKTTADLIGKKVGVIATNGNCDLILNDLLQKQTLPYKQVQYVALAVPELVSTLLTGGIDAACVPEPLLTPAVKDSGLRGIDDLFSGAYDGFPIVSYSVTKQFKQSNPKTFAALQRALARSLKFAHDHPDKVRDVLPGYTRIDAATARIVSLPSYPERTDLAVLSTVADIMNRLNVMGKTVKVPAE
jgi:NitT/TauT family transport system substrate-binding protein